jgi:hypothetical protein
MSEEEARELMAALSHNPLSLSHAEARWDPLDEFVIDVEATGGGKITLKDIESGRRLAREVITHETQATMRCGILEEDGSINFCSLQDWANGDFGYQRSEKHVQCNPAIRATRCFCGITNAFDGPPKFWRVTLFNTETGEQYGGDIPFLTSDQADEFIRRYIDRGCPGSNKREFSDLKNEYL